MMPNYLAGAAAKWPSEFEMMKVGLRQKSARLVGH